MASKKARSGRNVERKPPAMVRSQIPAEQISRRRPHGNCQIEDPQNPAALLLRKKISHKSRRNRYERRLADARPGCVESATPCSYG